ncbi:MAG: 8-amino-7-oxononanoate synthase [Bacteroidota bacterium]|nr:8-amino-7-oxononanoate synthase [Bacteroidota bacterium]
MLDDWLARKLEDRKQKDLLRKLPHQKILIDFTSNDYLGLSRSKKLYDEIAARAATAPHANGSTGSRLLSGNSDAALSLELKLAEIFQSPSALLFNSGYNANLGVLSSIPQKDDTIIYDELAHASIKDGARLSLAQKYSFRHNDLADLERKISHSRGSIFVAVESVYSMDGDECPLEELVQLSDKHGFSIILDEAHSTGARGHRGGGIAVEKSLHDKIDIRIYTFGKAMGVCGACVAGSQKLISYLVNFARPFIYTTANSPHDVISIGCAFDFLSSNMGLQQVLRENIRYFLDSSKHFRNRTKSLSAIQTVIIPGNGAVRDAADILQREGFDVRPILSPTVPSGKERLRICLHTFNTREEIGRLAQSLLQLPGVEE